jgi:phosphoribosyl-ATP pyrophosphohydrolase
MMEKLVREWSKTFGLSVREYYDNTITWEEKLNATRLIDEEYKELTIAIGNDDNPNIVEEAVDLIWVTIRLLQQMGVNADEALKLKFEANMTKGFTSLDEVTKEAEQKKCRVDSPSRGFYVLKHSETGKIQKPDHYVKPDFKTRYP